MGNPIKIEFEKELDNILKYWSQYSVDDENGGFYGQIDNRNDINKLAVKGSVLNSRILWTFSAAYQYTQLPEHLALAWRSFRYIEDFFIDKEFGGVYWSVDFTGKPLDTKKQVYAVAFAVYGIAEFYKAIRHDEVLKLAKMLFHCIEEHSFDPRNGGYLEAFSRDWTDLADLRLSDKDANEKKTMNTHLHILEAYTNLYRIWPDEVLGKKIRGLIEVFDVYIINKKNYHLNLFFDENWHSKSNIISYGHDIEASWLLLEAAEVLGDKALIDVFKQLGVEMATSTISGLDKNGGLNYELEEGHWNKEKHWWAQAEAMVGFLNAFQISGDNIFYGRFDECWKFIRWHVIDTQNGEWFWGLNEDFSVMQGQDKVGFWKCPYHNARACLEIIKRLSC